MGVEQPHREGDVAHAASQQQSQERAQQEPEQGLGRDAPHGAGVGNAADGQRDGGEHHRDDDQLQRLNKELANDIEDAEGALCALCGDVLEQEIVDRGPDLTLPAGDEALAQEHEGEARRQAADQRNGHSFC